MRSKIELSYVVPVFFNQRNTQVLTNLFEHYSRYDTELLSKIEFIIVDDCSPIRVTVPSSLRLNYKLLRIEDDIQWNQAGARNLGVVYASSPKIIITDCDHFFPEPLLIKILKSSIPKRTLFRFRREDAQGYRIKSAFNIFYTSKSVYFSTLGYDEEFCGNYGYEDQLFREFQVRVGNKITCFSWFHRIVSPVIDRENSYHSLIRDTKINKKLLEQKLTVLKGEHPFLAHSRLFLNFSYRVVKESWTETNLDTTNSELLSDRADADRSVRWSKTALR